MFGFFSNNGNGKKTSETNSNNNQTYQSIYNPKKSPFEEIHKVMIFFNEWIQLEKRLNEIERIINGNNHSQKSLQDYIDGKGVKIGKENIKLSSHEQQNGSAKNLWEEIKKGIQANDDIKNSFSKWKEKIIKEIRCSQETIATLIRANKDYPEFFILDSKGQSLLHYAIALCDKYAPAIIQQFKTTQINFNIKNSPDEKTPLLFALEQKNTDPNLLNSLLQCGADPSIEDKRKKSPISWAKKYNKEIFQKLMDYQEFYKEIQNLHNTIHNEMLNLYEIQEQLEINLDAVESFIGKYKITDIKRIQEYAQGKEIIFKETIVFVEENEEEEITPIEQELATKTPTPKENIPTNKQPERISETTTSSVKLPTFLHNELAKKIWADVVACINSEEWGEDINKEIFARIRARCQETFNLHKKDINNNIKTIREDIEKLIPQYKEKCEAMEKLIYSDQNNNPIRFFYLDEEGQHILHYIAPLCGECAPNIIKKFADAKIDINVKNREGKTPLFKTLETETTKQETINAWLQNKASLITEDNSKMTPLFWAAINNKPVLLRLMFNYLPPHQMDQVNLQYEQKTVLDHLLLSNLKNQCIKNSENSITKEDIDYFLSKGAQISHNSELLLLLENVWTLKNGIENQGTLSLEAINKYKIIIQAIMFVQYNFFKEIFDIKSNQERYSELHEIFQEVDPRDFQKDFNELLICMKVSELAGIAKIQELVRKKQFSFFRGSDRDMRNIFHIATIRQKYDVLQCLLEEFKKNYKEHSIPLTINNPDKDDRSPLGYLLTYTPIELINKNNDILAIPLEIKSKIQDIVISFLDLGGKINLRTEIPVLQKAWERDLKESVKEILTCPLRMDSKENVKETPTSSPKKTSKKSFEETSPSLFQRDLKEQRGIKIPPKNAEDHIWEICIEELINTNTPAEFLAYWAKIAPKDQRTTGKDDDKLWDMLEKSIKYHPNIDFDESLLQNLWENFKLGRGILVAKFLESQQIEIGKNYNKNDAAQTLCNIAFTKHFDQLYRKIYTENLHIYTIQQIEHANQEFKNVLSNKNSEPSESSQSQLHM